MSAQKNLTVSIILIVLFLFSSCKTTKPVVIDQNIKVNIPKYSKPLILNQFASQLEASKEFGMVGFRKKTYSYNGMAYGFDEIQSHGETIDDSKAFHEGAIIRRGYKILSSSIIKYNNKDALVINYQKDKIGSIEFESDYQEKYFLKGSIQYKYPEQQQDAEKLLKQVLNGLKIKD